MITDEFKAAYPELAAMFQALQDGINDVGEMNDPVYQSAPAMWLIGFKMRTRLKAPLSDIAAGLRMVADAIDPPVRDWAREAGPDLLDALEQAVSLMEVWHRFGFLSNQAAGQAWVEYQASPEMQQINAAIAKAKGETSDHA